MPLRIRRWLTPAFCRMKSWRSRKQIRTQDLRCEGIGAGWQKPIWPRKATYNRKALPLFLISVDEAKDGFINGCVSTPGANFCHFPTGRSSDYFHGLTCSAGDALP